MKHVMVIPLLLATLGAAPAAGDKEWAKGIPFVTKWDDAIKQAKETGRLLFIYNGWEGDNI